MLGVFRKIAKRYYLNRLKRRGLIVGNNFQMEKGCNIDANFPWLIKIGNNVTLASEVYLVAHDGASKKLCGYSGIGKVVIEDNVFIGAKTIVLCGVSIGKNSVIGAGSVVTCDIPANVVAAGNPAKVICALEEYGKKIENKKTKGPIYEYEYTISGKVNKKRKQQMDSELEGKKGFIV